MSMSIDGTLVVDSFEIWAVERESTDKNDSEPTRIVFTDENQARLDQKIYGGQLMIHTCYVTEGENVPEGDTEDLRV